MRLQLVATLVLLSCGFEETLYLPYDRDDWKHWIDEDKDCEDTRAEVLKATSKTEPVMDGCRVASGLWVDPYTGTKISDASMVDVDHIVALKDAHDSGGDQWDAMQKRVFANDPDNLTPSSRYANRSKGSKGPDEWLPPLADYRCEYIETWLKLKVEYGLDMTPCERGKVDLMQKMCEDGQVPPLPQE